MSKTEEDNPKKKKQTYCSQGLVCLQEEFLESLDETLAYVSDASNKPTKNWLRNKKIYVEQELATSTKDNKAILASGKISDTVVQKYISDKTFNKIRESYCNLLAEIDEHLGDEDVKRSTTLDVKGGSDLKLPRLNLPSFSGEYDEWLPFHNLFMATVHNKPNLDPVQKLHYLRESVTGAAYQAIKNLTLTAANYEKALDLLNNDFNHPRKIAHTYMRKLVNADAMQNENVKELKAFINKIKDCMISLESLGLPVEHWDYILLFTLQSKVAAKTNSKWEEELGSSREIPKFQTFLEFLEKRFRTLEMLEGPEVQEKESKKTQKVMHNKTNSKQAPNPKQFNSNKKNSRTFSNNKRSSQNRCPLCNADHIISKCKQFLNNTPGQRKNLAIQYKLCLNCLGVSHSIEVCYSMKTCIYCKQQHHSLLHIHGNQAAHVPAAQVPALNPHAPPIQQNFYACTDKAEVRILGTAMVRLVNLSGYGITVRVLLDSGAEDNYITSSTVNASGLKKYSAPSSITGLNDTTVGSVDFKVNFKVQSLDGSFEYDTSASIVDTITTRMPSNYVEPECFGLLNNLPLADPNFNHPGTINLLLGIGFVVRIRQAGIKRFKQLMAENTLLGWVIMGQVSHGSNEHPPAPRNAFLTKAVSNEVLSNQIQQFFEIEEFSKSIPKNPQDVLCEKKFLDSVKRGPDGKLSMLLPFKEDDPIIGPSKHIAMRRFLNLERRLERNSNLKAEYHETINDYIRNGHLIPVTEACLDGREYFLPHHAVVKESSTTTKVRVVFDGSCKSADTTSLNDHLLTGPKLQTDIRDVFFRWRTYQIALTADIAKMYRMFWVDKRHHNFQKILWRSSTDEPVQEYALTTVTFGTSSAPFQAIRSLNFIAEKEQHNYPLATKSILSEFYVDDFISGGHSLQEAVKKQTELRQVLSEYGLTIRKWSSNNVEALTSIVPEERETLSELSFGDEEFRKTLGVYWAPKGDYFSFATDQFLLNDTQFTKRNVLSLIARLYDPVGWVSPCTLHAKIIMQKIWEQQLGWDDEIDGSIKDDFQAFLHDLQALSNIKIPRWILTPDDSSPVTLYGFSDASLNAYGAVLYMLNPNPSDPKKLILLSSRTRVKPLKHITLARLELCAAVMLSELIQWANNLLQPREVKALAFSDSKIVLSWLCSHPSKWKMYVAGRTSKILEYMSVNQWFYINTKQNPADFASRGLLPSDLIHNDLWWNGPSFENLQACCQNDELTEEDKTIILTETKEKSSVFHAKSSSTNHFSHLIEAYSSHGKMCRIMAYVLTYIRNTLLKLVNKKHESTNTYLLCINRCLRPENQIIRQVQQKSFIAEIKALENDQPISKTSTILSLNPFLDGHGILRVGGRLKNASFLSYNQKYPMILPSHHQVCSNLIYVAHHVTFHGENSLTATYLRHKFHIIRVADRIKQMIHRCPRCIKFARQRHQQLMGSLPKDRVNPNRPFFNSGVDYAGPYNLKAYKGRCKKIMKYYVSLFVCFATKAVHLELVGDLTATAFLAAFKRFASRRGRIQKLYSDMGTNFVKGDKLLVEEIKRAQQTWKTELEIDFASMGTEWDFNPPGAPHFGGLWEAGVKSMKSHLNKTFGNSLLTAEEFNTALIQIEGILNSRPLTPLSNDPNNFVFLSPAHFLIGESIVAPPERAYDCAPDAIHPHDRWQYIQKLRQSFWTSWKNDYLQNLNSRSKWRQTGIDFKKGNLVLLTDENTPPTYWPTAIILECHPGKDGQTRVVTLKTQKGQVFKRPTAKLRLIPIHENDSYSQNTNLSQTN